MVDGDAPGNDAAAGDPAAAESENGHRFLQHRHILLRARPPIASVGPGTAPPSPPPDTTAAPLPFCAALRAAATAADCDAFKAQLATLQDGTAAFNPPKEMTRGIAQDVTLAIGRKEDAAETVASVGGNQAATTLLDAKLGRYMTATLSGGGFDITPTGPIDRDLGAGTQASWTWQVKPTLEGSRRLELTVAVAAQDAQGRRTTMRLSSRSIAVDVIVGRADHAADGLAVADGLIKQSTGVLGDTTLWMKALGALIIAGGGVWFALSRRKS